MREKQIKNRHITKTKHKPEKANHAKYSKAKLSSGSVAPYDTRPRNEVGLFYNAPEPTRGRRSVGRSSVVNIHLHSYSLR